jgi:predicted GIY-YIG superfamily endonuclease
MGKGYLLLMFYYTYVLRSEVDNYFYVGFTKDLKLRFASKTSEKKIKGADESISECRKITHKRTHIRNVNPGHLRGQNDIG